MVFTLFNAFGDEFQPIQFIQQFGLKGIEVVIRGDPMSYGKRTHTQSGFSVALSESIATDEAVAKIETFIAENKKWLLALTELPVESLFNIGMTVGGTDAFVPCLELKPKLLGVLADLKIGLHVYGYPTSRDSDVN